MPEIVISGPEGHLEGRYYHSPHPQPNIALLIPPHPQHGETMNSTPLYRLYRTLAIQGFSVLRFNFRGIGRSKGKWSNGVGELSDSAAALDWLQACNPNTAKTWVGGFAFGAWISMQLMMRRPEIKHFISLGLPTSTYDFSFLSPCPADGIVIHGEKDETSSPNSVNKLVRKLNSQNNITVDYQIISDASHDFSDHLDTLEGYIKTYVQTESSTFSSPRLRA